MPYLLYLGRQSSAYLNNTLSWIIRMSQRETSQMERETFEDFTVYCCYLPIFKRVMK